ncbi:MAG: HAD-superfamily [Desulfovibrionaceae bacterium]|nr:MAG: HAD-superfamily [Desulfovibrionaceae bacterium]
MSLQALVWDVDGTLADTEEAHRTAFNQAFAERNLNWRWGRETYSELLAVSGGKERIAYFLQRLSVREAAFARPLIQDLHARKTAIYETMVNTGRVRLREGVARLLTESAQAGLKLAIATTTTLCNVEALLTANLDKKILVWDVIVAGDAVPRKKPEPDVYLAVLKQLGLEPSQCLAIEDSRNGLLAASAAQIPCIVTPTEYTAKEQYQGALAVLDSLGEPDVPCRSIIGASLTRPFVDVAQLRIWHEEYKQTTKTM